MTQNLIDVLNLVFLLKYEGNKRMSISSNSNVDRNLCSQSDVCAQI